MAIANQITINLKYNRVQTSHEIHGTICRKVLDKTFDLEFFNCIHTVHYSKISCFIGDFTSHCGCLSTVVYLQLFIYSCFLFIVHNKEKTFILFLGNISPHTPVLRVLPWGYIHLIHILILILGITWRIRLYGLASLAQYVSHLKALTWGYVDVSLGTTRNHMDVSLGTTRSQGAMGDVSPRGTFRFPHAQSMVTLRLAIAAQTK